jgi:hypothetical protein
LINWVLPGLPEVFASFLLPTIMLINEDFPTFDRPMKAYSALLSVGHLLTVSFDTTNSAVLMIIILLY